MAWIINNSVLNPKVTTLPALDHYTEGSTVVLGAPYGDVEYEVIGGMWVPVRALTDIVMYVNIEGGVDAITKGDDISPFLTTQYATTLIPKKIKNLTINILGTSDFPEHSGLCILNDLEKTSEYDEIHINGTTMISYGENPINVSSVSYAFDNRIKVLHVTDDLPTEVVYSGGIPGLGIDPVSGYQYISWPEFDFKNVGVRAGLIIRNVTTDEYSFIAGTSFAGQGYMYFTDPIFDNTTQTFQVLSVASSLKWIMNLDPENSFKIGKCFPVIAHAMRAVFILNDPDVPVTMDAGDSFYGVEFPRATIQLDNINQVVKLNKLDCVQWSGADGNIDCQLINCKQPIVTTEVAFQALMLKLTPEIVFNRTTMWYDCLFTHCLTTTPAIHNSGMSDELDYTYDSGDTAKNHDTGILVLDSLLYTTDLSLYKSAMTIRHSMIDGFDHPLEINGLVTISDSYVRADGDNILLNVTEGTPVFYTTNNGVLDSDGGLYCLSADTVVNNTSQTGSYRYTCRKTYTSITNLLADVTAGPNIVGLVIDEPGNMYTRMNGMWVPRTGNQYTTEQFDALFAAPNVMIPNGLEIFNTTIGREVTWLEPPPIE